jgi:hypothetical protein
VPPSSHIGRVSNHGDAGGEVSATTAISVSPGNDVCPDADEDFDDDDPMDDGR